VLNNTQAYTGKQVTITGTVAQVVGPHALAVATNSNNAQGATTQTLLAVYKENAQQPQLVVGSPVQVTGALQPTFDTNQAQTFTGSALDQAALTAYNGQPYVQAAFTGPVSANLTGNQGANNGG
jgi:hypothetical protein